MSISSINSSAKTNNFDNSKGDALKKQRGISTGDLLIWMVLVGLLLVAVKPFFDKASTSVNAFMLQLELSTLKGAVNEYYSYAGSYAGLSMTRLEELELISSDQLTNRYGGNNSVEPGTNVATSYIMNVDGIPSDGIGERLSMRFNDGADSASYSGGALTITTTRN